MVIGIGNGFYKQSFGTLVNQGFCMTGFVSCRKAKFNAQAAETIAEECVSASVQRRESNKIVSRNGKVLKSKKMGCLSRGNGQGSRAFFQSGHPLFQNSDCGIGQPGINMSLLLQLKQARCMVHVIKTK